MKMRRTMSATKEVGERAGLKPQFNCLSLPPSLYWEIITRCGAFALSHWSNDVVRTSSLLPCSNRTHASSLLHIHIPQARRRTAQNIVENCARRWCKSAVPTQQTRTLPPRPGDHGLLPHALPTCGSHFASANTAHLVPCLDVHLLSYLCPPSIQTAIHSSKPIDNSIFTQGHGNHPC